MKQQTYQITETFRSLQGEGFHTGRSAFFIRFAGCNLECPWCDTDCGFVYAATKAQIEQHVRRRAHKHDMIVLTGGEPLLQLDDETPEFDFGGRYVALETNGTQPFAPSWVNWLTASPKAHQLVTIAAESVKEVKVVLDGVIDPEAVLRHLFPEKYAYRHKGGEAWYIQPCDGYEDAERKAALYVMRNPWWRLSLQTQKIVGIQ